MPDDRYAPPAAPLIDETARIGESGGEFEIGRALSDGWNACWEGFPLWLGVGVVATAVIVLSVFIPPLLGFFLIAPVIGWGGTYFLLNLIDRRARFGDLFAGFSRYGTALLSMLVLGTAQALVGWIGQSVQLIGSALGQPLLEALGWLVYLPWTLLVTARLYFSPFLVVDQGLGAAESLQVSWELTRGRVLRTAGLTLTSAAVGVAGFLALIIGVIPAVMIIYLMWTSAYRQLVGPVASRLPGARSRSGAS